MDRDAYIDGLPEPRRDDVRRLDAIIRETLPEAEPGMERGMLGYGPYHYRYASGREGDSHLISLASRKAGLSLYVSSADGEAYLAERYADRLGKVDVGKSCVRFRTLDDLDLEALRALLREAGERGGAAAV